MSLAAEVFLVDSTEVSSTRGISGTSSTLCPRAMTRAGTAEAARAEATAYLFWVVLIFLCHLRQVLVGAKMRPPRHMLPKAPCPEREVPPPWTRGIRDTARPVPQDCAEVWWPAFIMTAYAWRAFLAMFVCTERTTSGRMGAAKTPGSGRLAPVAAPSAP